MSLKATAAKILSQRSYPVPGKLKITEHFFEVPRDWSKPSSGNIQLFARSATKVEKPADGAPEDEKKKQLPWMIYLQGGPGFECPLPHHHPFTSLVLDKGYQIIFMDPRGTGLSTPLTASTLGLRGDDQVQAEYLRSFRADSIVADCEAIRMALTKDYPAEKQKWSVVGQSFGGFCSTTYLSKYPEALREVFIFGGIPPVGKHPDEIYERMYKKNIERNEWYYQKFPEDVERVKKIVALLQRHGNKTVRLPAGGYLTPRRFQSLGLKLGMHGGFDSFHNLILRASSDLDQFGHIARKTLAMIEQSLPFDDNIIYALLHEPIYCQDFAPKWSAARIQEKLFPQFNTTQTDNPFLFTAEMIFPEIFADSSELSKVSSVAELLAQYSSWPSLYDEEQLAKNEVPVYAAVYQHDMYVDYEYSKETVSKIKGAKTFETNVMYHNAISQRSDEVWKQLFALRDDCLD
ncbi:alpha/beta-hydrolase [Patellaria atrata CBS 101060]|uniref:Alpha/beta-hydrolase n=1 Tax=Patellaria atrata CBS 101060 TaxID=1346257 RepID=A0A9P4VNN2_9PEZI|nr:alpha/beta-hydrolase [Patellaria atrata CBS 101060]